jgi:hypothetical protein
MITSHNLIMKACPWSGEWYLRMVTIYVENWHTSFVHGMHLTKRLMNIMRISFNYAAVVSLNCLNGVCWISRPCGTGLRYLMIFTSLVRILLWDVGAGLLGWEFAQATLNKQTNKQTSHNSYPDWEQAMTVHGRCTLGGSMSSVW